MTGSEAGSARTVVTDAPDPQSWQVVSGAGEVVASGRSTPRGLDASSGQKVHSVDFSTVTAPGTGYVLRVGGQQSFPFTIAGSIYDRLLRDAMRFFYMQRSGIAIDDELAPGYARPAGHVGVAQPGRHQRAVPARLGDYRLDVPAAGTTPATTASTSSTAASPRPAARPYERARDRPGALGDGTLAHPGTRQRARTSSTRPAGSSTSC